jgi:hypothetical protein
VEFNLKAKLAGSFEEQARALQSAVGGPWMTRNEARAMDNLSSVDGADELIVPLNVIAGGLASPNDTAPNNPDNGPSNGQLPKSVADVLRAHFARQAKGVAGRLVKGHTTVDACFDVVRWDAELAADLKAADTGMPLTDINAATRAGLDRALKAADPAGAVRDLFDHYIQVRADQIAGEWEPVA